MERYDPSRPPDSSDWLELDEQERLLLVEKQHRRDRIDVPNATLHATIHVIVENQLAADEEPVCRALTRLMEEGLSRHDAIHAIGSVLGHHIYDLLKGKAPADEASVQYYASIERLTVATWHEDNASG
jgi:hypothetical protein